MEDENKMPDHNPQGINIEDVLNIIQQERAKMLERSYPVGGSPAFVIELYKDSGEAFNLADIKTAVKVRNALIGEGKNAVDYIHREAEGLHVSGVLLTQEGLENFQEVLKQLSTSPDEGEDSVYNADLKFRVSMATPHRGGVQYIALAQNKEDFTIFGPGVLAAIRGKVKAATANPEEIPVYRLADKDDDIQIQINEEKNTSVVRKFLKEAAFDWATLEEIRELPEVLFRKIDPESLHTLTVDMNKFMAVKVDINDSGNKIRAKLSSNYDLLKSGEDAQLIIAANFELESAVEDYLKLLSNHYGEFFAAFNRLGESRVYLFQKVSNDNPSEPSKIRTAFEAFMRDLAEREIPDLFLTIEEVMKYFQQPKDDKQKRKSTEGSEAIKKSRPREPQKVQQINETQRQKVYGHMSTIELPITGIVEFFWSGDQIIAIDQTWNKEEENRRERIHKERGMKPSEIYSPEERRNN